MQIMYRMMLDDVNKYDVECTKYLCSVFLKERGSLERLERILMRKEYCLIIGISLATAEDIRIHIAY